MNVNWCISHSEQDIVIIHLFLSLVIPNLRFVLKKKLYFVVDVLLFVRFKRSFRSFVSLLHLLSTSIYIVIFSCLLIAVNKMLHDDFLFIPLLHREY